MTCKLTRFLCDSLLNDDRLIISKENENHFTKRQSALSRTTVMKNQEKKVKAPTYQQMLFLPNFAVSKPHF